MDEHINALRWKDEQGNWHALAALKGDKGDRGDAGPQGIQGPPGRDGTNGTNGTNGQDGADGSDGYSPTASVTNITGGHRVTITDVDGDHTFDVMDGTSGSSDFDSLPNRPKYNGTTMTHTTSIPEVKTSTWDGKYTKPAGGIPDSDLASTFLKTHQDISGKLNIAQGIANAGKFLVVGSNGNVSLVTMSAWQGGSY